MLIKIDVDKLRKRCRQSTDDLMLLGESVMTTNGLPYTFINRGSNVLAVAHCDSVRGSRKFRYNRKSQIVRSPRLDDRLGVYVALDLLPSIGIAVDVLLTDGEESGRSTAEFFTPVKSYDWIVEFDRSGDDVVVYDDNDELTKILAKFWRVGFGSYSDICDLERLETGSFNLGIGYYNQHSRSAWCDMLELQTQIKTFAKFYQIYFETPLPVGTPFVSPSKFKSTGSDYDDRWYDEATGECIYVCPDCYHDFTRSDTIENYDVYNMTACPECGVLIPLEDYDRYTTGHNDAAGLDVYNLV